MAQYLVTGSAGFIGSAVARQLVEQGHEVVGVDNLNDAYDPTLKHWRLKGLQELRAFQFHQGDVRRAEDLRPLFATRRFDAVLNLAAAAGVRQSILAPQTYLETNASGTLGLLELCRAHDVPKFLLASTSSLYGAHNPRPFREDADTNRPLSPYAATKKAAEVLAAAWTHLYGMDTLVPRYFTVYGPGGRPDMSVFRFVSGVVEGREITVYGDGSQERDFTFVDDIAEGTIAALKLRGHRVVNLGSDAPVALSTMLALVEKHAGRTARIVRRPAHKADVHATWADITLARSELGWAPKVGLDEGIRRCVEWYADNRPWASKVELGET